MGATQCTRDGGQWAYIIPRRRFERYMAGDDLSRLDREEAELYE